MSTGRDLVALLARILLAVIFLKSGWGKVVGFDGTVAAIAGVGLPLPQLCAIAAILIELGCGVLLLVGVKARWAALAIALFLIPTTLIFHKFWGIAPDQYVAQQTHFLKNVAIMGGLLMVCAFGPGRIAVDRGRA